MKHVKELKKIMTKEQRLKAQNDFEEFYLRPFKGLDKRINQKKYCNKDYDKKVEMEEWN